MNKQKIDKQRMGRSNHNLHQSQKLKFRNVVVKLIVSMGVLLGPMATRWRNFWGFAVLIFCFDFWTKYQICGFYGFNRCNSQCIGGI